MKFPAMKPWTQYAHAFAAASQMLRQQVGPAPFGRLEDAMEWIAQLPFLTIISTDLECKHLSLDLSLGRGDQYRQRFGDEVIRWELILRCECALAFCQGKPGSRRDFDWQQDKNSAFRHLLIEFWRPNALKWARKVSPEMTVAFAATQADVTKLGRMKKRLARTDPSTN